MTDKQQIIQVLRIWFQPGDVFEVRVLDAVTAEWMRPHMESGYFDYEHIPDAAEVIGRLRSYRGAYATINPVKPDLLARACNRIRGITKEPTTSDADIAERRWLLVDCDPKRVSGVSSTDEEHASALQKARELSEDMASIGWPEPILTDSGNGAQMLYRVSLPADDGGLIQKTVEALSAASTDTVDIDITVHNPARIWRIPGTMNCKGDSIPSRSHRMAKLLSVPEKIAVLSSEQLESVANYSAAPCPEYTSDSERIVSDGFDIDRWIAQYCPELAQPQPWKGGRKWVFPVCPFNENHRNRSAVLIQEASGAIAFKCHHNGCAANDWKKLRVLREPGCYDHKPVQPVDISGILNQKPKGEVPLADTPSPEQPHSLGPMPQKLLHIPGFIEDYTDYTMRTGLYTNRVLAFSGALAFLAFLVGRKVRDERNNRSNIYLVALANSGTGKDHPRKVNMNVAFNHHFGNCIAESFGSGQGIEDALFMHPSMLFEVDEFDTVFNALKYVKDERGESVMEKLLRFYGASNGIYKMRKLAMKKQDVQEDDDRKIVNPNLVIFGTAIPKFFYAALSERVLANGLIARCMILDAGKRGRGQRPAEEDIPESITRAIEIINGYGQQGDLTAINPKPMVVKATPEAAELLMKLNDKYDNIYERYEEKQENEAMSFWARVFEKVCKLSMLYSISENLANPVISVNAVKWAASFVEFVTEQMLIMVDAYSFENLFDEKCRKALRFIRDAGGKIAHAVLLKRMHESADVVKQVVETLEENGSITHDFIGSGAKQTKFYRAL